MFIGLTALKDQEMFEIDVEPQIVQTNEPYPGNKMHWKFYELLKFADSNSYKNISKESSIKYQWLEFLIDCKN